MVSTMYADKNPCLVVRSAFFTSNCALGYNGQELRDVSQSNSNDRMFSIDLRS